MLHIDKVYGMKKSYESYPHEEPNKYVTPDHVPMSKRFEIVWRDKIGFTSEYVSETQYNFLKLLFKARTFEQLIDKGIPVEKLITIVDLKTLKALKKKGILRFKNSRCYLVSRRVPDPDPWKEQFIQNLKEKDKEE